MTTPHFDNWMAMMSRALFESLTETTDIMGGPDLMNALSQSIDDVRAGRLIPLEQVKNELV